MYVCIHSHQSVGQIGCVTEVLNPVALRVLINGTKPTNIYVALCLLHAPAESAFKISELHIAPVNYTIKAAATYLYVHYS